MDPHSHHSSSLDGEDVPACQSCRKRKLKCNREQPSCSHCNRLYTLEKLFLEKQSRTVAPSASDAQGCLYHAAVLIANQMNKTTPDTNTPAFTSCGRSLAEQPCASRKRKRQDSSAPTPAWDQLDDSSSLLPNEEALERIIDTYFSTVHHWIPFIHQKRFRQRLRDPSSAPNLTVLLHGMTVAAIRQVAPEHVAQDTIEQHIKSSRNVVLLNAMNGLSIENMQALALVAFESTGSANAPRTWSIIGSLVKSVEYLQLTVEPDETPRQSFMRPLTLLPAAQSPGEEEERRRVFWNVFLLDRFLSVTSGWNPSITAQDAHRRLPSNGKMWNSNERVPTPFFGILDRSTAKIGDLMHYVGPQGAAPMSPASVQLHEAANAGAFAFRIEATESLSQVTSCFLLQDVRFHDREQVSKWLARFKELDVRLVHWKLFFPRRWSDSSVSHEQTAIEMDPNLTLAHLTHNTSMILLHQHIGYPSPELTCHVKLPSGCSAETCHLAAAEIASIIGKFLSNVRYLVPAQVAFCGFIAARIMLVHWRFYNTGLSADFATLIGYLREMSRRWRGESSRSDGDLDIAARYAVELESLHEKCLADSGLCTQILLHPFTSAFVDTDPRAIHHPDTGVFIGRSASNISPYNENPSPATHHTTDANASYGPGISETPGMNGLALDLAGTPGDELAAVSNTLLGQQFAEMDRVFTLDGTDFTYGMGGYDSLHP